jgi:hypothetical protein
MKFKDTITYVEIADDNKIIKYGGSILVKELKELED